jgi:hypothetical protein
LEGVQTTLDEQLLSVKFVLVIAITLRPLAWRLTKYEWLGLESKENITYEKFTYDRSSLSTLIWGRALLDLISDNWKIQQLRVSSPSGFFLMQNLIKMWEIKIERKYSMIIFPFFLKKNHQIWRRENFKKTFVTFGLYF